MEPRFVARSADEFLILRTPVEPAEVMLLTAARAFESRMPVAPKDVVLECVYSISYWIL